jgi:hypothetical protein
MGEEQRRKEKSVSNVLDSLPAEFRSLVTDVLRARNETLLAALRAHEEPSQQERDAVEEILSDEFSRNLGPDDEPTQRGRDIDNALGAFLLRWPIDAD